ncbi:MAG: FAD:protein FMN transferase, partial [Cellvibrionales bacterium]|nr:FAD:protein FMN transferase [Cellvibrionales bacterium]
SLLVGSFFLLTGCGKPKFHTMTGNTMGTTYHVTAQFADKKIAEADLKAQIDARLESINQSMSTYKTDSEITQFNQMKVGEKLTVSNDFVNVYTIAQRIYEETDGAFDPTVSTLVDLWGFGGGSDQSVDKKPPSDADIKAALKNVGFDQVVLKDNELSKTAPVTLDFSAIAKGYGVDQVAELLRNLHINSFLVEVGGEIVADGMSPRAGPWRVAVTTPKSLNNAISRLELKDAALATSGNYRNYFDYEGVRYSHTINPNTGYPVKHELSSVTVIQPTSAEADAYATALLVMGVEKGFNFAKEKDLPVYMIYSDGKAFDLKYTDMMKDYFPKHQ